MKEKKKWILDKLKEYEASKEEYFNGGFVKILGQNCTVRIKYNNIKIPNVNIEEGIIEIEIPNKYKKVNKQELLNNLTQKIYNVIAQKEIERAMEKTRILLGYAPEDYILERINNTLGKCEIGRASCRERV